MKEVPDGILEGVSVGIAEGVPVVITEQVPVEIPEVFLEKLLKKYRKVFLE